MDGSGFAILTTVRGRELVQIPWSTVEDVEVIDASRMEIKSRVEQRASGGIWAPLGTTAPVSRTQSKQIVQSRVGIQTSNCDWLLSVAAAPAILQGKLLLTKELRAGRAVVAAEPQTVPADHVARLEGLAELRTAGVITEEDFQTKKAEILKEI